MPGWIKLSRDITSHWIWEGDPERLKWWLDLLMLAAWEETEKVVDGSVITLKPGEILASLSYLAQRWGKPENGKKSAPIKPVDRHTLKRFIRLLENAKMITHRHTHRYGIITICNWDSYQICEKTDAPSDAPSGTPSRTPSRTPQIKNKRNKEYNITSSNEDVRKASLSRSLEDTDSVDWEDEKKKMEKIEKPKKTRTKKTEPTLVTKARKIFEEHYKELYEEAYYWTAKDGNHMKQLLQKIKYSRENRPAPLPNDDESLLEALKKFLEVINKNWVMDNFSVSNINSQYNSIVAEVKNKQKPITHGNQITMPNAIGANITDSNRQQAVIDADVAKADEEWHNARKQGGNCIEVIALPISGNGGL